MNFKVILIILLFLSVILQVSFITFPAIIIFAVLLFFLDDSKKILLLIFLASILVDILRMETIGITSLFIFAMLFLLDFYRRSFEISDVRMIIFLSFLFSVIYAKLTSYPVNFTFILAFIIFALLLLRMGGSYKPSFRSEKLWQIKNEK